MPPSHQRPADLPTPAPARPQPSRSLAFVGLSLAVHLLLVAALAVISSGGVLLPRPKVVWLDLDNRLGAPQPRVQRPRAPKPQPALRAKPATAPRPRPPLAPLVREPRPKPRPKPARPPQRKAAPFATSKVALSGLSPGDAALMLLVRTDRVRRSLYAKAVRRLLEVFYDHKTFLWSGGVDPIRDFDALLIATPNPYRVTRTFLAARHHLPTAVVREAVDRAGRHGARRVSWSRGPLGLQAQLPSPPRLPHDPRVAVLREGMLLLLDPRTQSSFIAPPDGKSRDGKSRDAKSRDAKSRDAKSRDAKSRDGKTRDGKDALEPNLVERLQQMDHEGGSRPDDPGLLLQAVNLARLLRLPPDLPSPLNVQVTVPALAPALLRGVLTFASPAEARTFYGNAKRRVEAASRSIVLRLLGVGGYFDRIALRVAGPHVRATLRLSATEVSDLLELLRSFIPQVRVPGMTPRVPSSQPMVTSRPVTSRPLTSRPVTSRPSQEQR